MSVTAADMHKQAVVSVEDAARRHESAAKALYDMADMLREAREKGVVMSKDAAHKLIEAMK